MTARSLHTAIIIVVIVVVVIVMTCLLHQAPWESATASSQVTGVGAFCGQSISLAVSSVS